MAKFEGILQGASPRGHRRHFSHECSLFISHTITLTGMYTMTSLIGEQTTRKPIGFNSRPDVLNIPCFLFCCLRDCRQRKEALKIYFY